MDRHRFDGNPDTDPYLDRHQNGNSKRDQHQHDTDPQHCWQQGGGEVRIYILYCIMSVPDAGPVQKASHCRTALLTAAVRGLKHNT